MSEGKQIIAEHYKGAGKLAGKVALITGGNKGIGRACAVLLAREGCKIAINFRRREDENAQHTKQMVEREGQECFLVPADLTVDGACHNVVQTVKDHFKRLDVLVNNAGVLSWRERFEDLTCAELQRVFAVNCFAPFELSKAAIPFLQEHEGSSIINMSSITAFRGFPELPDYSASKAALLGLTRSLSGYLCAHGKNKVRVNAIAPGPIKSPLTKAIPQDKLESIGKATCIGRVGQPEEVATCVVFLATQDSCYITGQTLHPNGGEIVSA
jgi:NAD(P)-dependent dehydrogenase (short-subunit alcohol dehydrogenase family)